MKHHKESYEDKEHRTEQDKTQAELDQERYDKEHQNIMAFFMEEQLGLGMVEVEIGSDDLEVKKIDSLDLGPGMVVESSSLDVEQVDVLKRKPRNWCKLYGDVLRVFLLERDLRRKAMNFEIETLPKLANPSDDNIDWETLQICQKIRDTQKIKSKKCFSKSLTIMMNAVEPMTKRRKFVEQGQVGRKGNSSFGTFKFNGYQRNWNPVLSDASEASESESDGGLTKTTNKVINTLSEEQRDDGLNLGLSEFEAGIDSQVNADLFRYYKENYDTLEDLVDDDECDNNDNV